jgi:hypothetical protein
MLSLWCFDTGAAIVPAHRQEALIVLVLERGTCCLIHPIVCGCPLGGRPWAPTWQQWTLRFPRRAHRAQKPSVLMPTFPDTITCSARVCPFACAFLDKEPWSFRGCPGGEYTTAIIGPYAQEGAPLQPVAPSKCCLDVVEADMRTRARQIHASAEVTSQRKSPAIN